MKKILLSGIITSDKPTANGRIYPFGTFEKAVKLYVEEWVNTKRAYGQFYEEHSSATTNLDKVSHVVESLGIVNGRIRAIIRPLDTPDGKRLQDIMETSAVHLVEVFLGTIHDNVVDNLELLRLDVIIGDENA